MYSNHNVRTKLGVFWFKHLMNLQLFKFGLWLKNCESLCSVRQMSWFRSKIDALDLSEHSFGNLIEKNFNAIISTINHVLSSGDSSLFTGLYTVSAKNVRPFGSKTKNRKIFYNSWNIAPIAMFLYSNTIFDVLPNETKLSSLAGIVFEIFAFPVLFLS